MITAFVFVNATFKQWNPVKSVFVMLGKSYGQPRIRSIKAFWICESAVLTVNEGQKSSGLAYTNSATPPQPLQGLDPEHGWFWVGGSYLKYSINFLSNQNK